MNVSEAIRTKRAVRNFQSEKLKEEEVREILNAGRRAQSAKNSQPWHFIAVQDKKLLQALSETGTWADHLSGAALGIAILTPPPEQRFSILFDAGQAAAYMQLAAWNLGIGSCLATVYEPDIARELLRYPQDYQIHIIISFGYPLDPDMLTDPPKKGGRKQFDETVHWETW